MVDIKVTLYTNKRFLLTIPNKHKVIAGENISTRVRVQFPEEYETFSKRVDFLNEKGEKWTEALYTPEYNDYEIDFNRSIFEFLLPDAVTFPGEFYMQFIAYDPNNHTLTPFDVVVFAVEKGILYAKKKATDNPDLIVKSYEHSLWAVDTVNKNLKKTEDAITLAEEVTQEAKDIAEEAQERAENAEKSAFKSAKHAKMAKKMAESAEQKSKNTEIGLSEEIERAKIVEGNLQTAIEAETARAILIEGEIASNLTIETERATVAEQEIVQNMEESFEELKESFDETNQELKEMIQAEETARIQCDEELQVSITTETERATAAEQANADVIAEECIRAKNAEENIATNLNSEIERVEETENEIVKNMSLGFTALDEMIQSEKTRAESAEEAISLGLSAEIERAKAAEEVNSQAIVNEKNRAETAEDELQERITVENIRAIDAENIITSSLDAEIARALDSEQRNFQLVSDESDRAQVAEDSLQTAIVNETNRALIAENTLSAAITTETNRATLAEAGLGASITSEGIRATTQESLLSTSIQTETVRAMQAEADLRTSLTTAHQDAVSEANAYTDEVVEQVRLDGTIYRGTIAESELPEEEMENGDLYWISDFDITQPSHSGSAIWNGETEAWDFSVDRYKHQDDDTIVARYSDGALKVADTIENELTADTTDYETSVNTGFKATVRGIIRKIKGLFQRTAENAIAISEETIRSTTVESQLTADILTEEIRAKATEQVNASAVVTETTRAIDAEQAITQALTNEIQRATQIEAGLEANKVDKVVGKGLSTEDYTSIEKQKLAEIIEGIPSYYQATKPSGDAFNISGVDTSKPFYVTLGFTINGTMNNQAIVNGVQKYIGVRSIGTTSRGSSALYMLPDVPYLFIDSNPSQPTSGYYLMCDMTILAPESFNYMANNSLPSFYYGVPISAGGTGRTSNIHAKLADGTRKDLTTLGTTNAENPENLTTVGYVDVKTVNKVEKIEGKGLSTEDFTSAEKQKLAELFVGSKTYEFETVVNNTVEIEDDKFDNTQILCLHYTGLTNVLVNNIKINGITYVGTFQRGRFNRAEGGMFFTSNARQQLCKVVLENKILWLNYVGADYEDLLGIPKSYSSIGQNTDGFMTQKAVTDNLDSKLDKTGGTLTGNLTIKASNKLIGSGNGNQDADWLRYDNSSNYFHVGNTGTVPAINSIGNHFYRRNSAGAMFKVYDEGNPPPSSGATEIPLTFSDINASVENLTGYYLKESENHGRLFIRFYVSTTINYWTNLFTITNSDIPKLIGNRLGFLTTMGGSSFNGTNMYAVSLGNANSLKCSANLGATWEYTAVVFI